MPLTPSLPTWLAWNNANFTSPTGLSDAYNGQPIGAGGLNIGAYFDATDQEAGQASYATNGILYAGRYRLVQVDSGATAANVKTGTVGFLRAGGLTGQLKSVIITSAGTGGTVGTYTIASNISSGGGSGAIIQVVIGGAGTVTSATVLNGGFNYNSLPTFSLAVTGGSGTVAAQLDTTPNIVTSFDQATVSGVAVRPVVFLNSITPGNYGFIQELGTATVLGNATFGGTATVGGVIQPRASGAGTVEAPTVATAVLNTTIGLAIDLPIVSSLFKIKLGYACVPDQD